MKRKMYLRTLILITAGLFMALGARAGDTIVDVVDIDIDIFEDQLICVKGLVTEFTPPDEDRTGYYVLKGRYGGFIEVNTSGRQPIINRKYKVKGIVKANAYHGEPYMVEMNRRIMLPLWIFFAIGGVGVLILVIILLLTMGNKSTAKNSGSDESPSAGAKAEPKDQGDANRFDYDDDFKTVQVVTGHGLTLVVIAGKLKLLDGVDSGKVIELQGKQIGGQDGQVTVGRAEKQDKDRASHIRINEPTVSKIQAELTWYATKKRLVLKNLSKVNYSQVNGEDIMVDETCELKFGDKIKFGNREFEYIA